MRAKVAHIAGQRAMLLRLALMEKEFCRVSLWKDKEEEEFSLESHSDLGLAGQMNLLKEMKV